MLLFDSRREEHNHRITIKKEQDVEIVKDYWRNDDDDDDKGKKKQILLPIYASSHIDNMVGELNNKKCLELLYGMRKMRGKSEIFSIDKER